METLRPDYSPVTVNPGILGGTPVFTNSRVPIKTLFDYFRWGYSLEEFLDCFPTVNREAALMVLSQAEHATMEKVTA